MIITEERQLRVLCEEVKTLEEGEEIAVQLFKELGDRGIGLAANQIGNNKRVCVINVKEPIAFINPKITNLENEILYAESCLSFPNKTIKTKRAQWVTVESDNHGKVVFGSDQYDDDLLEAVCVQHEIDHLDGITMFDREVKQEPIKVEKKIGRNERVTITDGKETKELKWKKAEPLVESGDWEMATV